MATPLFAKAGYVSVPEPLEAGTSLPSGTKKFPKSARILKSSHYRFLQKNARRLSGRLLNAYVKTGRAYSPKLGITVSKKFGKAHERNRFKRVVREAFRELRSLLPRGLEVSVSPRHPAIPLSTQEMLAELKALLLVCPQDDSTRPI